MYNSSIPTIEYTNKTYVIIDDLSTQLSAYALKSDIKDVDLTNYIEKKDVYTTSQADEKFVDEDELAYELDKYETKDVADWKYALKSNVITEEQLIKKCAIDCGPFTEGADISLHYLKIVNNVIKLEYIAGNYAERNEIRILFYDTDGNPHNIVILLYQRTVYLDNFKYSLFYEEIVDLTSLKPLTYKAPIAEFFWTTTQELLDERQIYSRCFIVPAYLANIRLLFTVRNQTPQSHITLRLKNQ